MERRVPGIIYSNRFAFPHLLMWEKGLKGTTRVLFLNRSFGERFPPYLRFYSLLFLIEPLFTVPFIPLLSPALGRRDLPK